MILNIYRGLTYLAYPFVYLLLRKRLARGKEDFYRIIERKGNYREKRPDGRLIWLHGASVGECLSMMPLVNYLVSLPNIKVLVTSGTVTSAELMKKRLPAGAIHQYVPVDLPTYTRKFIEHWHPDLGLFFESDFWPNLLMDAHKEGVPLILLNGRISDKSFKSWSRLPFFIRSLLKLFTFGFGQTQEDADRMKKLGFKDAQCVGNLKFAAVPAPFDLSELSRMKSEIGERFVWVAGSTHDNEEELVIEIHQSLQRLHPNMLTVIAPRHPNRADEIEKMIREKGLTVHRRSKQEDTKADVYLADTIGEMGLIYRLSHFVFVGGSLIPFGGQNMLEPMRIGACTFIGPYAFNFKEIVKKAADQGALIEVKDKFELLASLEATIENPQRASKIANAGQALANSETAVLQRVVAVLLPYIFGEKKG